MATSTQWLQPAGAEQSKQVMRNGNNIFYEWTTEDMVSW